MDVLGRNRPRPGEVLLRPGRLFERPEVKDFFRLLTLLTDRRAMGLVRVACWPELQMPLADAVALLDQISIFGRRMRKYRRDAMQNAQS